MEAKLGAIKQYVLSPDSNGSHLRQMADYMAMHLWEGKRSGEMDMYSGQAKALCEDEAAETIASYIHLVWDGAGPEVYAPRMFEMLCGLRDRVSGMDPSSRWEYAIAYLADDTRSRLRQTGAIEIDTEMETALVHRFFDGTEDFAYLHDVADHIEHLHWERKHSPAAPTAEEYRLHGRPIGARGEPLVETHLKRTAIEGLAAYVEQANIARGRIDAPTDPTIVLRDRIDFQMREGGKNADTWDRSGWMLADHIEERFGTAAGRREARLARAGWKAIARSNK